MSSLRPLLLRSPLLPGESFPSLLARLVGLNRYPRSNLLSLCFQAPKTGRKTERLDNLDRPLKVTTYERLAVFTGQAPDDLYAATVHRYAAILTPSHAPLSMSWRNEGYRLRTPNGSCREIRATRHAQFCPRCLKEAAYHRLIWMPISVTVCLPHQCLLVHQCPQCGKGVSVAGVVQTRCSACGPNLMQANTPSLADTDFAFLVQRLIQAWLEGQPPPSCVQALPPVPSAVLCDFLRCLRYGLFLYLDHSALTHMPQGKAARRRAEEIPWVQYELNRLAFQAAVNWPQGFLEFVDKLKAGSFWTGSPLRPWVKTPHRRVIFVSAQRYWAYPGFEFVRQVLPPVSRRRYSG